MSNPLIIIDNHIPFIKGVLEPFATVQYLTDKEITAKVAQNADALLIRTRTKVNQSLLYRSSVKLVATATIGLDHIDLGFCKTHQIQVNNVPGCNSWAVAQYIAAAMVHISGKQGFSLTGKTIGIIGVGNVGSKVAKVAKALGMKVLLNDPPRAQMELNHNFVSLTEIQERADFISFHTPLTHSGKHTTLKLGNSDFFSKVKLGAIIMNTSRGELIDQTALLAAIKNKKVSAGAIDVWENEPNINPELLKLAEIATAHIAGYSTDGKANATAGVVKAVSEMFGFPLHNWYPPVLPKPTQSKLIETNDISKAIRHCYPIAEDSLRLKNKPSDFELLRNNYPVRREFSAYSVNEKSHKIQNSSNFELLGFNIS